MEEEVTQQVPEENVEESVPQEAEKAPEEGQRGRILEPVVDLLIEKYGVEPGDLDGLVRAIRLEAKEKEEAPKKTEPPQKEEPDPARQERLRAGADRIYGSFLQQAAEIRRNYPNFDLRQEMNDPRFVSLLRNQVDMRTAYEALHSEEVLPAAMEYAARAVEQGISASLQSALRRPVENGMGATSAATVRQNASRMSRGDYQEVCRRIERGERVSFG